MTEPEKARDRDRARIAALERLTRELTADVKALTTRLEILEAVAKVDNKPKGKA